MKTPNLEKLLHEMEHRNYSNDDVQTVIQALRKATEALENHHKHWNMPDDKCSGECSDTCRTLTEIESLATKELG